MKLHGEAFSTLTQNYGHNEDFIPFPITLSTSLLHIPLYCKNFEIYG